MGTMLPWQSIQTADFNNNNKKKYKFLIPQTKDIADGIWAKSA